MQIDPAHRQVPAKERLPGFIETTGTAFALLNQRPYLILTPVLVDLYLWLGFRLSVSPITDRLIRWIGPETSETKEIVDSLRSLGESLNLFDVVALLLPSLIKGASDSGIAGMADRQWISDMSPIALILVMLGLLTLGIVIGAGYLTIVGYLVRGEPVTFRTLASDAPRNAGRVVAFFLTVALTFLLLAAPVLVFTTVLLLIGINILALAMAVLALGAVWLFLLLFFSQHAIVVSEVGPFRAAYLSYNIVRSNFWPSVGFIAAYMVILSGMPIALHIFTQSPWSVPFALIGHAYIATGLIAAAMLFYRARAARLPTGSAPSSVKRHSLAERSNTRG